MVKDLCFEIIEKCLNNCMFCSSNSNFNKTQIIQYEDFKRTIDYFMSTGGIEELSLSGGEPFLHPDVIKMVRYSKKLGIRTVIFTSGVSKNAELSEKEKEFITNEMNSRIQEINRYEPDNEFLKQKVTGFYTKLLNPSEYTSISRAQLLELKEIGLDKIVFDYQAYEDETDHMLMGRKEDSRISLLKSIILATTIGLEVDIHFVPMKPNYKEIGDILEMLEIAGVQNISILNFLPQGRGRINQNDLELSEEEIKDFLDLLKKYEKVFSGKIRIGIPLQGENEHKCNAGLEKLDIKYDGTILPCPAFKEITPEEFEKYNITLPNIYRNLEEVKIPGRGTRVKPLCKQIYSERTKIS